MIFIILICIFLVILIYKNNTEEYFYDQPNIIGYIHVCQSGNWHKSFDLLMDEIKNSGLYDNTSEIRIGIVNSDGKMIPDERFNDKKIKIIYEGKKEEYERPTILHMKENAKIDSPDTIYFYLHTKGISHFGTIYEDVVIKWIKDMLYWNISKWRDVSEILKSNETYGINYNGSHYSGNFWWTKPEHVHKLPKRIASYYTAPEDWIMENKDNYHCANNCHPNYIQVFPNDLYSKK